MTMQPAERESQQPPETHAAAASGAGAHEFVNVPLADVIEPSSSRKFTINTGGDRAAFFDSMKAGVEIAAETVGPERANDLYALLSRSLDMASAAFAEINKHVAERVEAEYARYVRESRAEPTATAKVEWRLKGG